jgi:hypothetical protein
LAGRQRKNQPTHQDHSNPEDYEAHIIKRIAECEEVINHLADCPAFKVITRDLDAQKKLIDDNWHQCIDEKKLQEFRVTKFAIMHLVNLKDSYEGDLKTSKEELAKLRNTENEITKDYDTETQLED